MYMDILILSQLIRGPKHGYEIRRNIERNLGNNMTVNNNILYPALKRFEKDGIVRKEIIAQAGKPSRTVYHASGRAGLHLRSMVRDFKPEFAGHPKEFFVRVLFLGLLKPSERKTILQSRKASLEKDLRRIESVLTKPPPGRDRYFRLFMNFIRRRFKQEIQWISELESVR